MPVNSKHAQYIAATPKWKRMRDFLAGQDAVHAAGQEYLPKLEGQSDAKYKAYLKRALFFAATQRTLDVLTGLIFRKPPKTEIPIPLEEIAENIDLDGNNLQGFAERVVDEVIGVGRAGILTDHQGRATTGARPFLRIYRAEDIWDWRQTVIAGAAVLTHVRLHEMPAVKDPEDEFATKTLDHVRVLDLKDGVYSQRVFQKVEGARTEKEEWEEIPALAITPNIRGQTFDRIPFVIIGPKETTPAVESPPLLELANTNWSHYLNTADIEHGAHFTALPTAMIFGHTLSEGESAIAIGSEEALIFPDAETNAEMLEFTGQGLGALEARIAEKQAMMAQQGARVLAPEKRAAEAAETEAIRRGGENSVLSSIAQAVSAGVTMSLEVLSRWAGAGDAVLFELNRDYLPAAMTPAHLTSLVGAWQAGALTEQELFDALQQGEIIGPSETFKVHKATIELTGEDLPGADDDDLGDDGSGDAGA